MSDISHIVNERPLGERERMAEAFASAMPFPHISIDGFFQDAFLRRLLSDFPSAEDPDYAAFCVGDDGKVGSNYANGKVGTFPPAYVELDRLSADPDFLSYLSDITGIPGLQYDPDYFGAGIRESGKGTFLPAHIDFNYHPRTLSHRRLNFLLYLNEEWNPAWGGNIEFHLDPGKYGDRSKVSSYSPIANRVVIFETSEDSWHAFDRIDAPGDMKRRAWSIYFYTKDRPDGENIKRRNTEYVEPALPERFAPGHVLDSADVELLKEMIQRRDSRIEMLYGLRRDFEHKYSHLWNEYEYYHSKYKELTDSAASLGSR